MIFSNDGCKIYSGGFDKNIIIWNLTTNSTIKVLKGHTDKINHIICSPNGKYIVSASHDKSVRVWS